MFLKILMKHFSSWEDFLSFNGFPSPSLSQAWLQELSFYITCTTLKKSQLTYASTMQGNLSKNAIQRISVLLKNQLLILIGELTTLKTSAYTTGWNSSDFTVLQN